MTALEQGRDARQNLTSAVKSARKARDSFSPFWKKYISEIKGRQRRSGKGPRRLTNYPWLFERTFLPQVAARNPHVFVEPEMVWEDAMIAEITALAVNEVIVRQKFIEELRSCIRDGMYAFMYAKTYISAPGNAEVGSFYGDPMWMDATIPGVERISPFDALWDDSAESFRRTVYCGHEFTRDLDSVLEEERYDPAARQKAADSRSRITERTKDRYQSYDDADIPPMCNLIELFVRPTRMIYTLLETSENQFETLRKAPFNGPEFGPYHMRAFTENDEVTGMAPAAAWWDAYTEYEMNMQRANEDAQAEKRVAVAEQDNGEGAKKFKAARPNDLIIGPSKISEVHVGGVTQERMEWTGTRKGELELLSGVSAARVGVAQSGKTATAEYIAESNADTGINEMRRTVVEFAQEILDDVKHYIHTTPSFAIRASVTSPQNLTADVMIQGGPSMDPMTGQPIPGQSPPSAFRVRIDAKSLYQDDDATKKAQALQEATFALTTVRPFLMSQGMDINAMGFVRELSQKTGMSSLVRNLVPLSPMAMAMMQQSQMNTPSHGEVDASLKAGGGDKIQSEAMNSEPTNHALSNMGQMISPQRMANTMPGANNAETSPLPP